jgi:hypothetical protein
MSPQMNGEPRDGAVSTSDIASVPTSPPSASHASDLPVPSAINADRLTKTTIKDNTLAPLFTQDAAVDFRSRWDMVQKSFVDDPKDAVHAADELVGEVTQSLTDTFVKQRSELEQSLDQAEAPTTEKLRIALRQYRSFFDRLLTM